MKDRIVQLIAYGWLGFLLLFFMTCTCTVMRDSRRGYAQLEAIEGSMERGRPKPFDSFRK